MSQHTPGPWRVANGFNVLADTSTFVAQANGGMSLEPKVGMNEAEANARLIAAAPEMLAALWTAREDIADHLTEAGYEDADLDDYPALKVINAALAKAEGK